MEAAWDAYSHSRKSPITRKAGPGFADPDYEISVDWLAAPTPCGRYSRPQPNDLRIRQENSPLQILRFDFDGAVPLALQLLPEYSLGQTDGWMNEIYPMWVAAHVVIIVAPVNWYHAPTALKAMIVLITFRSASVEASEHRPALRFSGRCRNRRRHRN